MTLNVNSRLFKYAFFLSDIKHEVKSTSLCGLFWRCVLTTLVITLPTSGLLIYLFNLIFNFSNTIGPTLFMLFIVGVIIFGCYADDKLRQRKRLKEYEEKRMKYDPDYVSPTPGLVETAFYAIKNRVCPIIPITRD